LSCIQGRPCLIHVGWVVQHTEIRSINDVQTDALALQMAAQLKDN
jgi:hypothetical protein